ncbi:EamA family transporter [Snodgrassella sp.]|uniref:EamA family transporter n=1 Tax=Snodgrassella sp. TaxID=2815304 RepID=UPI00258E958A|nr:EamA family transporter [Snodgrassella sp.]MCO6517725.1 EamA family transporter [Snodgrassella sp.]
MTDLIIGVTGSDLFPDVTILITHPIMFFYLKRMITIYSTIYFRLKDMSINKQYGCRSIVYLLITVIGWGIMYPASKHAVSSGIDGYYLTFIRYVLGAVLVSVILIILEGKQSYQTKGKTLLLWFSEVSALHV